MSDRCVKLRMSLEGIPAIEADEAPPGMFLVVYKGVPTLCCAVVQLDTDPGEGWQLLDVGSEIQNGDEFQTSAGWVPSVSAGALVLEEDPPYRRRVPSVSVEDRESVEGDKESVMEEGWRRLAVGEQLEPGDEFKSLGPGWVRSVCSGCKVEEGDPPYRRRIEPAPVCDTVSQPDPGEGEVTRDSLRESLERRNLSRGEPVKFIDFLRDMFEKEEDESRVTYRKASVPDPPTAEDYLAQHRASGLKVGDRVRVTRKAEDYEGGWSNTWVGSMDPVVGKERVITRDGGDDGFRLDSGYGYPCFVLEKVEERQPREFWVNLYAHSNGALWSSKGDADANISGHLIETVHLREVIE